MNGSFGLHSVAQAVVRGFRQNSAPEQQQSTSISRLLMRELGSLDDAFPTMPERNTNLISPREAVEYCAALWRQHPGRFRQFVNKLAHGKRFDVLQAIYDAESAFSAQAAEEVAATLDSDNVVAFCRQFKIGSRNWEGAFMAFRCHEKKRVIDY